MVSCKNHYSFNQGKKFQNQEYINKRKFLLSLCIFRRKPLVIKHLIIRINFIMIISIEEWAFNFKKNNVKCWTF